jgi:4a-hydroxytetrahydrobiopterin dehydratase
MDLTQKKCAPCEGGVPPIRGSALEEYLAQIPAGWEAVEDGKKIRKEFKFKDFKEAIDFVVKVAKLAEEEGHHPDIFIFYSRVVIELWTHAIGGLSENDFILAAKIGKLEQ